MASDNPSSFRLLYQIWGHLSRRRRFQLALMMIVMLSSGLAELLSLGAVLPFLAVLTNPVQLWQQPWIQWLVLRVGVNQPNQLVIPVTLAFALAAVLAAVIRLLNFWLNGRLAAAVGSDLSSEAYLRTLYQPYQVHVRRNSSTLISAMTQQIDHTVLALNAALASITALLVSTGLLVGLLLIDWQVAVSTVGIFGIAYGFISIVSRRELLLNSKRITSANSRRLQSLQEGLGAIREVLLDGSQAIYLSLYRRSDRPQRLLESKNRFISIFPRFALEALGLVIIAFLGGILVLQRGGGAAVIPLLGTLALGAQRLLPALQQIYSGWANLNNWNSSLYSIVQMLEQPLHQLPSAVSPFVMKKVVKISGVHFSYSSGLPEVLQGLDLEIKRGERIGLIGATGSGKSTFVDVLMGLLPPSSGKLFVDGFDLYAPENANLLASWRASVAHVPQNIYLADTSIAQNIAFGVPKNKVDMSRVKEAADQAQISGYINSIDGGYESLVGERGIRLSGGQRQRIGIARALYRASSILVFDEATSALDNHTEEAVMSAIDGLGKDLTIVMIAHRLSTLRGCSRVIRLTQGRVLADGPQYKIISDIS